VGPVGRRAVVAALAAVSLAASACSRAAPAAVHHLAPGHAVHRRRAPAARASTTTSTTTTVATTTTTTLAPTTTTLAPLRTNPAGALPQTDTAAGPIPSAATAQFHTEMDDLWQGILTDSLPTAIWAFFPEAAYDQLKAIADPDADWRDRLVAEFAEDLAAAHDYVMASPDGRDARLLYVAVDTAEVAWIPPGYCYNSIGYWHAPGVRLVYEQDGATRSIGIASLISWRGQWYVVHLGAVLRPGPGGFVDAPSPGQGQFAPAGGC